MHGHGRLRRRMRRILQTEMASAGVAEPFVAHTQPTRLALPLEGRLHHPALRKSPEAVAPRLEPDRVGGPGAAGTENWLWQGGTWTVGIPALGGMCALTVGQAMPPEESSRLAGMIALTRLLAQITVQGHIVGEAEASSR